MLREHREQAPGGQKPLTPEALSSLAGQFQNTQRTWERTLLGRACFQTLRSLQPFPSLSEERRCKCEEDS